MSKTTWGQSQAPAAWVIETWDRMEQDQEWQTWLFMLAMMGRVAAGSAIGDRRQ